MIIVLFFFVKLTEFTSRGERGGKGDLNSLLPIPLLPVPTSTFLALLCIFLTIVNCSYFFQFLPVSCHFKILLIFLSLSFPTSHGSIPPLLLGPSFPSPSVKAVSECIPCTSRPKYMFANFAKLYTGTLEGYLHTRFQKQVCAKTSGHMLVIPQTFELMPKLFGVK